MIRVDGSEIRAFSEQLRDVPQDLRKGFRRNIKAASTGLVRDIQANYSWSSRIPGAVKTKVGFGARSAGVTVFVDRKKAPHARPLEFGNRSGANRHPVFGTDAWVNQPTRPSFLPAVRDNERKAVDAVQDAIDDTFRRL